MIIVSAATGEFGRLVVECLLDRLPPSEVAVAVRDPAKAHGFAARGVEVRHGDYDDAESLRRSFEGADRLLFISSPMWDSAQRMVQHRHVIAAAREAEVGLLVYTSAGGADVSDQGGLADHHDTEQAIIDSGVPSTMLRHPFYSEIFINAGLQVAVETGELTSSTGGRGLNTATRADLAEAAAAILTSDGHANRGYTFTGPLWTYPAARRGAVGGHRPDRGAPRHRRRRGHDGDDRPGHAGRRARAADRGPRTDPRSPRQQPPRHGGGRAR